MEQNISTNTSSLQVDSGNIIFLTEAAKWAKFLAIVGFVICALMIVFGLFAGTIFTSFLSAYSSEFGATNESYSAMGNTIFVIVYSIIAIIYFIPCLYLFNFASKAQTAIRNNDQVYLNASFKNLKSFFKFWGIMFVILLCFYAIIAIFAIVGGYTFSR